MRRLALILFAIFMLLLSISPTAAQGGSIASIVDGRSDLSTLSVFLEAAPEIREILQSSGSYTLLAPNNTAFENLSSALGIPLADLLRSPEIVNSILSYHILEAAYTSQELAAMSGQVLPTSLMGAFVSVRVNDQGILSVNNVVEIVSADIRASNGRIHVINDVLLNRVIQRVVDNIDIASLITPNAATAVPEASPEVTEAPTAAVATPVLTPTTAPVTVAFLRFAHFAAATASVEIYANGEFVGTADFGQVAEFQAFSPDIYEIAIRLEGESENLLESTSLTLLNGDFKTLILTGEDTLQTAVVEEDFTQVPANTARVLFYQAAEGLPTLDLRLDDSVVTGGITFTGRTLLDIEAGTYNPQFTESGERDNIIFDPEDLSLEAGHYYLLALVGNDEAVQWILSGLDSIDLDSLKESTANQEEFTPTPATEAAELGNLLEVLEDDGNFSILIEALEAAEDDVINRLGSRLQEPVTLLAPTDEAFTNLFATLGLSQGRVFANRQILSQILRYHVVEGQFSAEEFRASAGTSIPTLLRPNQSFFVTVNGTGNIFINGRVRFVRVDVQASNGVIHVIDDVLLPQSALDAFGL